MTQVLLDPGHSLAGGMVDETVLLLPDSSSIT
jgi:hypothetical protein